MAGKHIELFLVDGTPGGLTVVQILNWTGQVLSCRRSDAARLLSRDEVRGTCVYLLQGESGDGTKCYIGETDDFPTRLAQHVKNKDFWDRLVVITSKDANLTKAHGRYLEAQLISLAKKAGRVQLDNATVPPIPGVPEAHESDMNYFLGQIQVILPVLGVDAIRVAERPTRTDSRDDVPVSPIFTLTNTKHGVDARAQQIDGEFTMLSGSRIVADWQGVGKAESTKRAYQSYNAQHAKLMASGAVQVVEGVGVLIRDVAFASPSTAGAIAQGRSTNGRTSWVAPDGTTFGEWESTGVET